MTFKMHGNWISLGFSVKSIVHFLFFSLQKTLIHQLSKKIQHDQQQIDEKQHQIFNLQKDIQKQQKLQDEKELHEFLHTENLALTETLADTEIENERLKEIIERKDGELSKSEEQCRHLVRVNEQRHQEVLSAKSKAKSLESKARNMILQQVYLQSVVNVDCPYYENIVFHISFYVNF